MHRMSASDLKGAPLWHLNLPIPEFPMSFISMDLVGLYKESENGNQYALMVICMLTNYIFMIPTRSKSTEKVIKAYLTGIYSILRGRKYFLSDCDCKFTRKQFAFLAKVLGFYKVCTSPFTPTGISIEKCTHSSLKASISKLICNHQVEWNETVHIATMAYNISHIPQLKNLHFTLCLDVMPLCQLYSNSYFQNFSS